MKSLKIQKSLKINGSWTGHSFVSCYVYTGKTWPKRSQANQNQLVWRTQQSRCICAGVYSALTLACLMNRIPI